MCTMCVSTICTNTNATIYVENGVGLSILTGWGFYLIIQLWPLQRGLPLRLKFQLITLVMIVYQKIHFLPCVVYCIRFEWSRIIHFAFVIWTSAGRAN